MIHKYFLLSFCLLSLTHFMPHFPFVMWTSTSELIISCLLFRLGLQGKRGGVEGEGQKGAGGLACTPEWADGEEQGQQQVSSSSALTNLLLLIIASYWSWKIPFSPLDWDCFESKSSQKHLVCCPLHTDYCTTRQPLSTSFCVDTATPACHNIPAACQLR